MTDEGPAAAGDGPEGEGNGRLAAVFLVAASSPWLRFAFRAAIPIVIVIAVAILVASH